jgi:hypothetical protein
MRAEQGSPRGSLRASGAEASAPCQETSAQLMNYFVVTWDIALHAFGFHARGVNMRGYAPSTRCRQMILSDVKKRHQHDHPYT